MAENYLQQNSSFGLCETIESYKNNSEKIVVTLDVLALTNFPLFSKRKNEIKGTANSLYHDIDHSFFPNITKKDAGTQYAKYGVMQGLENLLDWKISQVSCDSCELHASKIFVPYDSSYDYNFTAYMMACNESSHRPMNRTEGFNFDLKSIKPTNNDFKGFMIRNIILTELGFYNGPYDYKSGKTINFANAHAFFRKLYSEKIEQDNKKENTKQNVGDFGQLNLF
ncbi:hypothetical protein JXM83_04615 [Candidatus Woesearchaeota archaeon]|nr:hypothetical protein [Candidatus Woesearchaeota archaeon]